jgi:hypothetical protein
MLLRAGNRRANQAGAAPCSNSFPLKTSGTFWTGSVQKPSSPITSACPAGTTWRPTITAAHPARLRSRHTGQRRNPSSHSASSTDIAVPQRNRPTQSIRRHRKGASWFTVRPSYMCGVSARVAASPVAKVICHRREKNSFGPLPNFGGPRYYFAPPRTRCSSSRGFH